METIRLSKLDAHTAAALLGSVPALDPSGMSTPASLIDTAHGGECFAATSDTGGQAVYVVRVENGVAWVDACQGTGATDWSATLLTIIEKQAHGLKAVGFQTARPGLVRKAKKQGYRVAGWIMKKELP